MSTRRLVVAAAAVVALSCAGVAAAGDAPDVSAQRTHTGTAPLTVPGTGLKKGHAVPRGARLISRDVALEGHQVARVVLRAPDGTTLRGIGMPEGQDVRFGLVSRSYVGRRRAVLRATVAPGTDGEASGRVYALAR
jgi:hypothetical protein